MDLMLENKSTKLGRIPIDWEAKTLGELGSIVRGSSPRPAGDPRYFNGSYIPWLTVAALTSVSDYQMRVVETEAFLTAEGSRHSRKLVAETVVISNSGATLGVAKILGLDCCANDGIAAITEQRIGDKRFICHYINTQTAILRNAIATGNGQPNLNTRLIRSIVIPFPGPAEQGEIADILDDVSALQATLDRLISKKRDLKQAVMQQLLTAQVRLPGFCSEWNEIKFGDHITFLCNGVNSRAELQLEVGVRYLHYGDVHACRHSFVSPNSLPFLPASKAKALDRLQDGDLIFADASEDLAGVGKSVEIQGVGIQEVVSGMHTIAVRFDKRVLADGFKGYLQYIPKVATHLRRHAAGTKVLATHRGHIASIEVALPGIEEQTAIAQVLSDMDAEIAALERRREKTRLLKQAMMQELLTGRTRLV